MMVKWLNHDVLTLYGNLLCYTNTLYCIALETDRRGESLPIGINVHSCMHHFAYEKYAVFNRKIKNSVLRIPLTVKQN